MEKYFLGLDIGTNSVGWAVTDDEYKISKYRGHKMWGARLFDDAQTAAERRGHRTSRRRTERSKKRLKLLEEIFAEEISKVDIGFFQRLEDSKFYLEDKHIKEKNILFTESEYDDKQYFKDFPTIYHLRDYLMKSNKKEDIRLIFLACHHIIKNRGHFLYEGNQFNRDESLKEAIKNLLLNPELISGEYTDIDDIVDKLEKVISDKRTNKKDKKTGMKNILSMEENIDKKRYEELFNLCIGSKVNLTKIFGDEISEEISKLSFEEKPFEEIREEYEKELDEKIDLIDCCKKIYDGMILSTIIESGKEFSEGKIISYEKHREDLKILKKFLLEHNKEDYAKILRKDDEKGTNYVNYAGNSRKGKRCSQKEFYDLLKKTINDYPESDTKEKILKEVELGLFLPLQRSKENAVIPYQIHKRELEKILNNASEHYEFLNEKEDEITTKEKIISILEFRIPYYVGPLNDYHKKFSWLKKISNNPIKPWNFDEVVDKAASAQEFIMRMTNKCTYLPTEDVIPKASLLYSEFTLLNEINNITCNGRKLDKKIKEQFIEDNFKNLSGRKGKVTKKKVLLWLVENGFAQKDAVIAGIDVEIKGDLRSYRDMKSILGDGFNNEMAENIIKWITLFGDAKNILKGEINNFYGKDLSDEQIKKLLKLKYKDWGRLSKEFLTGIQSEIMFDEDTGEFMNIITALRENSMNLNEVLANGNGFDIAINKFNEESREDIAKIEYDLVDKLKVSPAIKRGIWQTILIAEEIRKIKNQAPDRIFIEMTRENESEDTKKRNEKRRKSRKEQLLELYKDCENISSQFVDLLKEESDDRLRSKKLYLYYLQGGKSAYSNEIIDLYDLMSGNSKYDLDHIWPRSQTKDDSIDNMVLCLKTENGSKKDNYPLNPDIQRLKIAEWKWQHKKGLMSDKKFYRLTRTTPLTEQELAGFINRQIVETSQTAKATADILKRIYPDSDIVYVKASNVSEFRYAQNEGLENKYVKVRSINDFHHAHDAYFNIVVGNVYDYKFTRNPSNFIKNTAKRERSLTAMYKYEIKGGNSYIAWKPGINGTQAIVSKEMKSMDIRVTRKVKEQKGELFNANLIKASKVNKSGYLPIKMKDSRYLKMDRYGGYKDVKTAYYSIYKYTINKKGVETEYKRIGFIPLYLKDELNDFEAKTEYFKNILKLKPNETLVNLEVIYDKLRMNTKVKINGMYYRLGGKTGENIYIDNAVNLVVDIEIAKYIKLLEKEIGKEENEFNYNKNITPEKNLELFEYFRRKLTETIYKNKKTFDFNAYKSEETKENFQALSLYNQSKALFKILNVITNMDSQIDLKLIGISTSRVKFGVNLNKLDEFTVIEESITGLYEKQINIL